MSLRPALRLPKAFGLCVILTSAFLVAARSRTGEVEAATKPNKPWTLFPTRTLEDLPFVASAGLDSSLSKYGGQNGRKEKATGFFYTKKINGRWWFVDPEGELFLNKGVASVTPLRPSGAQSAFRLKFGDAHRWAETTSSMLGEYGFNGVGAWSDIDSLRSTEHPVVYTRILSFMSGYGHKRGGTYSLPGHTGYPGDCIFVFDPGFEKYCDQVASTLAVRKNDPWLLGYFSDNELPFSREDLRNYLKLPVSDHGHQAAMDWLREQHGPKADEQDITPVDEQLFLSFVVDRYFGTVSRAIRKYDPNHLFLGSRFYGSDLSHPETFNAAGRYADVISVNYYGAWSPAPEKLSMWERKSGRPILITEWYAKGMDSHMPNTGGAGWVVKTQADRGKFYQNFALGLIESKVCVGWHWFKYADNDPDDTQTDPSNRDSNKGILNNRYEPYTPLLEAMKQLNLRTYSLVNYFDAQTTRQAASLTAGDKGD